jgi:hypothetical protein
VVHLDEIFTSVVNAFERLVLVVLHVIKPLVVAVINALTEVQIYLPRFFAQDIARRGPPIAN